MLALVMLVPVKHFDISLVEAYGKEVSGIIAEKTESLAKVNADLTDEVIAKKIDAYILKQLDVAGIECKVKTTCKGNDVDKVEISIVEEADTEKVKSVVTELGVNPGKLMLKVGGKDETNGSDFR